MSRLSFCMIQRREACSYWDVCPPFFEENGDHAEALSVRCAVWVLGDDKIGGTEKKDVVKYPIL